MRKFAIVLLAVVFVLGMSSGVIAASGNLEDEDVSDTVDFDIDVDPMATVEVPDNSLNLTIEDLQNPAQKTFDVTVASNTNVVTYVSMSFDNNNLGTDNEDLGTADLWDDDGGDDWLISPNIVDDGRPNTHSAGGSEELIEDSKGWRIPSLSENENGEVTSNLMFETNINQDADWTRFNADDTVEGSLTFTVSAE